MNIKSALLLVPFFAATVAFNTASAANAYRSYLEYTDVEGFRNLAFDRLGIPVNSDAYSLPSNTPPYFGSVTLTEGGMGTGAYVDVRVEFLAPFQDFRFVDTGNDSNKTPFSFSLFNPGAASLTNLTVPWVANQPLVNTNPPFGSFNYGLTHGQQGGSNAIPGPLTFRVVSTNGITFLGVGGYYNSLSDFQFGTGDRFMSNFGGWWFAADSWAPGGATGAIAARDLVVFTAVPEPETYSLLAVGLGLMGFVAARRRKKIAA